MSYIEDLSYHAPSPLVKQLFESSVPFIGSSIHPLPLEAGVDTPLYTPTSHLKWVCAKQAVSWGCYVSVPPRCNLFIHTVDTFDERGIAFYPKAYKSGIHLVSLVAYFDRSHSESARLLEPGQFVGVMCLVPCPPVTDHYS